MSTYGQEPPADPWTDETQPVPPPFTPGHAAPPYAPVQPVAPVAYPPQGIPGPDPYAGAYQQPAWQPPKQQKSTVVIVLITLLVVVVLAAAGVSLYLFVFDKQTTPEFIPPAGTCISVTTSEQIIAATCGAVGAYKVIEEIPVPDASQQVAATACASVAGGSQIQAYYHVTQGTGQDYVLCLGPS